MINSISAGLIKNYVNFQSKTQVTSEEMFKKLSIEMGGDGSSITKDQLNSYIEKADSGSFAVSKDKLDALKNIQKNWDKIAGEKDSIEAGDLTDYSILLLKSTSETTIESTNEKYGLPKADFFKYLMELLGNSEQGITKNDLTAYLKSLIAGNSDENDNGDEIAMMTNLIADFNQITRGSEYMKTSMITESKDLVA